MKSFSFLDTIRVLHTHTSCFHRHLHLCYFFFFFSLCQLGMVIAPKNKLYLVISIAKKKTISVGDEVMTNTKKHTFYSGPEDLLKPPMYNRLGPSDSLKKSWSIECLSSITCIVKLPTFLPLDSVQETAVLLPLFLSIFSKSKIR